MSFRTVKSVANQTVFPSAGYLLDMDGVLYHGRRAVPGAADFIRRVNAAGTPYLCITNHACYSPRALAGRLAALGIAVPASRILTSGLATAAWLRGQGTRRVFAIGERPFLAALAAAGIDAASKRPTHVVVALDRRVTYARLAVAARHILGGAAFVGTNPDPSYPTEAGPAPECGFYLAALERMTGRTPIIIGKPAPHLFQIGALKLGLPPARLTMVGDRLDTDIRGAKRLGLRAVLVLSGSTTRPMLRGTAIRPDRVADTIGDLPAIPQAQAARKSRAGG